MRVKQRIDYSDATQFVPQVNVWPLGVMPFATKDSGMALMSCATCGHRMISHGTIRNLKGLWVLCPGDWVITHADGQQSICKIDNFPMTYEPVENADDERIDVETGNTQLLQE